MKPIYAFLMFTLASAGAACSASTPSQPVEAEVTEASAEGGEVQGTLNLNIGRTQETSSGLIVGSGSGASSDGLIVAPQSSGGNFEDVPSLDIELDVPAGTLLETPQADSSDEDEIVRLKPEN